MLCFSWYTVDADEGGWQPLLPSFFASHQGSDKQRKGLQSKQTKKECSVQLKNKMFLSHIINAPNLEISILLTTVLPVVNLKSKQYNK